MVRKEPANLAAMGIEQQNAQAGMYAIKNTGPTQDGRVLDNGGYETSPGESEDERW